MSIETLVAAQLPIKILKSLSKGITHTVQKTCQLYIYSVSFPHAACEEIESFVRFANYQSI